MKIYISVSLSRVIRWVMILWWFASKKAPTAEIFSWEWDSRSVSTGPSRMFSIYLLKGVTWVICESSYVRFTVLKDSPYHGYAMRKILPLCIKTVTFKSKGFLCLFDHNSRIHCFWLKNLNLFSQNITFRVINYLNLVEKIIRNWNVDEVSVPIISKDIR